MDHSDDLNGGGQSVTPTNVVTLSAELLVYILLFLSIARDVVNLRYVSRRFWSVCEVPSLWRQFIWPHFNDCGECCVKNVLKSCGLYTNRVSFLALQLNNVATL